MGSLIPFIRKPPGAVAYVSISRNDRQTLQVFQTISVTQENSVNRDTERILIDTLGQQNGN